MKRKIQKWMIKAPFASFCLFGLPFGLLIALLFWFLEAPFWLGCIFALIFMFCIYLFIDTAPTLYLQEPAKCNDQRCDPYPLLEDTKELLSLKLKPANHFEVSIGYITALLNTGKNKQAEEALSALDLSVCQNPIFQFNYYALFAELSLSEKSVEQAIFFIDRMEQINQRLKLPSIKKMSDESLFFSKAGLALLQESPEEALHLLNKIHSTVPIHLVNRSILLSRAYLALKNRKMATLWLEQVVQMGNRLYAVEEAQKLLAEIEGIQEK